VGDSAVKEFPSNKENVLVIDDARINSLQRKLR